MKHYILVIQCTLLLLFASTASSSQSPLDLVRDTSTEILVILNEEKALIKQNPDMLHNIIAEHVLPHFDFERMGRWTLGKYWRKTDQLQRDRFMEEFRTLLIRSYGNVLVEYTDADIVYLPFKADENEKRAKVHTELSLSNSNAVRISYSLHMTAHGWKVYDVAVEGISLVTNYRNSFIRKVSQEGIDQLISQLASKNSKDDTT